MNSSHYANTVLQMRRAMKKYKKTKDPKDMEAAQELIKEVDYRTPDIIAAETPTVRIDMHVGHDPDTKELTGANIHYLFAQPGIPVQKLAYLMAEYASRLHDYAKHYPDTTTKDLPAPLSIIREK